tara:strand:- start:1050 stop:1682 length:633 start_codon:yes stop_codon:yes gene_type:complete
MPFFNVRAPALPQARDAYDPRIQNTFSDVLRLYFNRLDADLNSLSTSLGASQLNVPTASYYDTTTQTATSINTAYKVKFGAAINQNGIAVSGTGGTRFTVERTGIYNVSFTGQKLSSSASAQEMHVWVAKNGTAVANSAHAYSTHNNSQRNALHWNYNIALTANEYIELMWSVDATTLTLAPEGAATPHPAVPSASLTINFISNTEGFAT